MYVSEMELEISIESACGCLALCCTVLSARHVWQLKAQNGRKSFAEACAVVGQLPVSACCQPVGGSSGGLFPKLWREHYCNGCALGILSDPSPLSLGTIRRFSTLGTLIQQASCGHYYSFAVAIDMWGSIAWICPFALNRQFL